MTHAPAKITGWMQDIFQESATQKETLGAVRQLEDGRVFAYAKNAAVALAAGKLTQSAAPSANANDETVAADAAVGDLSVSVTFGGAVTADFYKDGWLWVNDDTGEGHIYQVKTHAAGTTAVIVYLKDPIRVAITAGAGTVSLVQNTQNAVIVAPTTLTSAPAGVPLIPVTASYYFWNQVKGPCPILIDGTVVIGQHVRVSDAVAGAVEPLDRDGSDENEPDIGTVLSVNANTEYGLINLAIPGY
jgi:hypothetical protein